MCRWRWWTKARLILMILPTLSYGGLLLYARQQFGATPPEVNNFISYVVTGKGRLKPAPPPSPAATRNGRWVQDIEYLAEELPRLHANAFHTISSSVWTARVQQLKAAVPHLSDAQLTVGVLELAALIGDGHTDVMPWSFDHLLPRAPVSLRWYGQRLYVTAATGQGVPFLGSEIVEIGGVPTQQAVELATRVTSGDSNWDRGVLP